MKAAFELHYRNCRSMSGISWPLLLQFRSFLIRHKSANNIKVHTNLLDDPFLTHLIIFRPLTFTLQLIVRV